MHGEESIAAILSPSTLEGDLNLDEAVITFPNVSDAHEMTGIITEIIQYKGGSNPTPESTSAQGDDSDSTVLIGEATGPTGLHMQGRSILLHTSLCPSSHESVF